MALASGPVFGEQTYGAFPLTSEEWKAMKTQLDEKTRSTWPNPEPSERVRFTREYVLRQFWQTFVDDRFDLGNAKRASAMFSSAMALMDKIGGLEEENWVGSRFAACQSTATHNGMFREVLALRSRTVSRSLVFALLREMRHRIRGLWRWGICFPPGAHCTNCRSARPSMNSASMIRTLCVTPETPTVTSLFRAGVCSLTWVTCGDMAIRWTQNGTWTLGSWVTPRVSTKLNICAKHWRVPTGDDTSLLGPLRCLGYAFNSWQMQSVVPMPNFFFLVDKEFKRKVQFFADKPFVEYDYCQLFGYDSLFAWLASRLPT